MEENTIVEKPISDLNPWDTSSSPEPSQQQETKVEPENVITEPVKTEVKEEPKTEVKVEPVIQEKIVEKIVEKFPEFKDDYSKQLFEAIQEGKEDVLYDYLSKKNKDYNTMSDIDVVKEQLKLSNPTWNNKDIETEIKYKFGSLPEKKDLDAINEELNPDEYQRAVEFNDAVEQKELLLTREARDARLALNESKKNIEFPKIKQEEAPKEEVLTAEQIDELNRKWESHVAEEMPKLADFKFKVGDEEVSYKISDEDRATQTEYMKDFSGEKAAKDLGWLNADGSENVVKIAEDMLKLKNMDKIVASMATQMKTKATKDVVAEIKNIDLDPSTRSPDVVQDLGAQIWS